MGRRKTSPYSYTDTFSVPLASVSLGEAVTYACGGKIRSEREF